MDKFEALSDNMFTQLNLESSIERIDHLEKQMYTKQSKYSVSVNSTISLHVPIPILTIMLRTHIELKEIQHLVICLKTLEQFTGVNLINPYAKELQRSATPDANGQQLSKYSKSYLKAVCQFERLYQMYMSSKNKKDVMITQKYALETYGLLAKGDIIILACVAHNRTSKSIGDILNEQHSQARQEKERKFLLKYF